MCSTAVFKSTELEPTINSKAPGSTTRCISMFHMRKVSGVSVKVTVLVSPAARLNGGLGQTESVDAPIDGFKRQRHGRFLNLGDGRAPQSERVSGRIARGGRHVPEVRELLIHVVAKFREPRGINVAHEEVRVVHTAHFIVVNVLATQPGRHALDHAVGLLRDGFLRLHLQDKVRATL